MGFCFCFWLARFFWEGIYFFASLVRDRIGWLACFLARLPVAVWLALFLFGLIFALFGKGWRVLLGRDLEGLLAVLLRCLSYFGGFWFGGCWPGLVYLFCRGEGRGK